MWKLSTWGCSASSISSCVSVCQCWPMMSGDLWKIRKYGIKVQTVYQKYSKLFCFCRRIFGYLNWQLKFFYLFWLWPPLEVPSETLSLLSASLSAFALSSASSLAASAASLSASAAASRSASCLARSSSACSWLMAVSRSWGGRLPPFHRRRIRSASWLTGPSGWKGFSHPSFSLKL